VILDELGYLPQVDYQLKLRGLLDLVNGRPVSPEVRGNSALNFVRKFAIGSTDIVLLEDVGGTACPELFFIVSVAANSAHPTREFGSCGALLRVS